MLLTDDIINPLSKRFIRNGFGFSFVKNRGDARDLLLKIINESVPQVVSYGDSVTLRTMDVLDDIKKSSPRFIDTFQSDATYEQKIESRRQALLSDLYITGVNGISLDDASMQWIDMVGNRISAISFGPKKVILVAGRNKLAENESESFTRIRQVAAPLNIARHPGFKTPCAVTGKCIDCSSPDRICNIFLSIRKCFPKGRIHLILIDEDMGL